MPGQLGRGAGEGRKVAEGPTLGRAEPQARGVTVTALVHADIVGEIVTAPRVAEASPVGLLSALHGHSDS